MKKVIAYLRVSTDNQVGEDRYGLSAQRADIEKYARVNKLAIMDWYVEEGVSGGKLDRPELNRLLSEDVNAEAVIVAKTDRLSRDIQLYYFIKLSLAKKNLELISVQEDWNGYGAMAPMLEAMVVAFAEFERQMITSRTSNGRRIKAANGGYAGGRPPYGYIAVDGKYEIVEEEAEVVRYILTTDQSLRKVTAYLNEMEVTTRSGAKWYPKQVGDIRNRMKFYQGLYKYGDQEEWIPGEHEAILK